MMDDPAVAEQILAQEDARTEEWHPSLAEYGLTEQLLTQIVDGLQALQGAVIAVGNGKPERMKPFPRPRTYVDELRERRSAEAQATIIALFTPHANT